MDILRIGADIVSYVVLTASYFNIDVEEVVKEKFNTVSDRFDCDIKL